MAWNRPNDRKGDFPSWYETHIPCDEYPKKVRIACVAGSSENHKSTDISTELEGCSDKDDIKYFYTKDNKNEKQRILFKCKVIKITIRSYSNWPSMRVGVLAYQGPANFERTLEEQFVDGAVQDPDVVRDDYDLVGGL